MTLPTRHRIHVLLKALRATSFIIPHRRIDAADTDMLFSRRERAMARGFAPPSSVRSDRDETVDAR